MEAEYVGTCLLSQHVDAEEDCDSNQGDSGRSGEELAVIDTEVPDHTQEHHKHRHHEAAHVDTKARLLSGWGQGG